MPALVRVLRPKETPVRGSIKLFISVFLETVQSKKNYFKTKHLTTNTQLLI